MVALEWSERLELGRSDMDDTHREMIDLMNAAAAAGKAAFPAAFSALLDHTRDHFAAEEAMMAKSGDPAATEHAQQHAKLLGEMAQLQKRVDAGRVTFARAFIRDRLPDWLVTHAQHMDSLLASHLAKHEPVNDEGDEYHCASHGFASGQMDIR